MPDRQSSPAVPVTAAGPSTAFQHALTRLADGYRRLHERRQASHDVRRQSVDAKRRLIDAIRTMNASADERFLRRFDVRQLRDYHDHLAAASRHDVHIHERPASHATRLAS